MLSNQSKAKLMRAFFCHLISVFIRKVNTPDFKPATLEENSSAYEVVLSTQEDGLGREPTLWYMYLS